MPSLTWKELHECIQKAQDIFCIENLQFDIFIESGTYLGDTVQTMKYYFKELHTIEVSKTFYDQAKERFKKSTTVHCHHGDSPTVLSTLLPKLHKPLIFWLDAHWSMGNTEFHDQHVPLFQELETIMNYDYPCLVLIDDVRLFGKKDVEVDWTCITEEKVFHITSKKLLSHWFYPSSYGPNDRLILLLK